MSEDNNAIENNEYNEAAHVHQLSDAEKLNNIIQRIEELELQRSDISAAIKDVYNEAKCEGFDTKILRQVVRMRKMEQREIEEEQSVLALYLQALGMLGVNAKQNSLMQ